jgi:membrane protein DedA with SNARE-associated domain
MELLIKIIPVLGLGALEIWAAIPAGFALSLNPFIIGIVVAIGAISGTAVILFTGDRLRNWLMKFHRRKEGAKPGLIEKTWEKYGVIGLGLLAPLITGAPLAAALGLILGGSAKKLMIWISLGILIWTTLLTVAGYLGIESVKSWWK